MNLFIPTGGIPVTSNVGATASLWVFLILGGRYINLVEVGEGEFSDIFIYRL